MQDIVLNIIRGLPSTIGLTIAALSIGLVLGVPLMLARISKHFWLRLTAMALITFVRSIPPIVWLFVIFFGLGSGYLRVAPFPAAVVGLGLIASAYMAEIYRGALLSIHRGQWEGAAALGMHPFRMWVDVIMPQLIRVALPAMATYAIGLLKDTAIASTIGVSEMTFYANQSSMATYRGLEVFSFVALLYIALSLPVAWMSRSIDARMRKKVSR